MAAATDLDHSHTCEGVPVEDSGASSSDNVAAVCTYQNRSLHRPANDPVQTNALQMDLDDPDASQPATVAGHGACSLLNNG